MSEYMPDSNEHTSHCM